MSFVTRDTDLDRDFTSQMQNHHHWHACFCRIQQLRTCFFRFSFFKWSEGERTCLCYFLPITNKDVSYSKQVNTKGHRTALTTIMIRYIIYSMLYPLPVLVPSKATEILLEVTADVSDTPSAHCKTWKMRKTGTNRKEKTLLPLVVVVVVVVT